jgi:hypothetical protein
LILPIPDMHLGSLQQTWLGLDHANDWTESLSFVIQNGTIKLFTYCNSMLYLYYIKISLKCSCGF